MKVLGLTLVSLMTLSSTFAQTECLEKINNELNSDGYKKTKLIHKKDLTTMGKVARILGATAVGVTAGGTAGLILPYAITGLTYGAMGVTTGLTAAAIHAPSNVLGIIVGSTVKVATKDSDAAWGTLAGVTIVGWLVDWGFYNHSFDGSMRAPILNNAAGNMFKAASNVGSVLLPLATSHFLPIGAIIGGLAGAGVAIRDVVINDRYNQYSKAHDLISDAVSYPENKNLRFEVAYKKLSKKLRKKYFTPNMLASQLSRISLNANLCPLKYKEIVRLLKTLDAEQPDYQAALINMENEEQSKFELAEQLAQEIELTTNDVENKDLAVIIPLDEEEFGL